MEPRQIIAFILLIVLLIGFLKYATKDDGNSV